MKIKSVKQESILQQFYIYFLVASIIPLFILVYLVFQFVTQERAGLSPVNLRLLMLMAIVFSVLGFWGTRSFLVKIVSFTKKLSQDTKESKIDKSTILELAQGEGEIAYLAKLFTDVTTRLEENVIKLEDTKRTLHSVLAKIGNAIGSMGNLDGLLQFILETIMEALGGKRAAIYALDEGSDVLRPRVVLGIESKYGPAEIKLGEGSMGWVAREAKSLLVPALEEREEAVSLFSPPLIASPISVHEKVWGAVSLSGKERNEGFTEDELKILSNLAYQIAVVFENAQLNAEAERTYLETISALALAVEAKDPYSRGHSEKVSEYATKIAEKMGLSQDDLGTLRDASRLHDIGKIGVSDDILQKPGRLNAEEQKVMQRHSLIGEGIVKPLKSFSHILAPIRHHHEFLDGSGYPDGLKTKDISLITRILTVADIYEALTSNRPYRKALSQDEAERELNAMIDQGKIDKDVVACLFNLIETGNI